ncbi:unnamed protein product, partial [Rotaria sordida]
MIILGIFGAILTVLVFTKQRRFWRNPSINYLLAGAVMTGIHLPAIYLQSILVNGFGLGLFNTDDIACREHNYLLYMTTVAAISFPCWAAFDQYASTCRNASFRHRWSSIRIVRLTIICTIVFWTIVYLPIIFVSGIVNGTVRNLRGANDHRPRGRLAKQVRRMLLPQLVVLVVSGVPFGFQ